MSRVCPGGEMKYIPAAALTAILLVPLALHAQSTRDFSGTWTMDLARSQSAQQGEAIKPVTFVINQIATQVRIETKRADTSFARAWRSGGMNSQRPFESEPIDLARDVPTTAEDIAVLRRLRLNTPSWLSLTPAQFEALVPDDALDRRPAMRPDATPFTLS